MHGRAPLSKPKKTKNGLKSNPKIPISNRKLQTATTADPLSQNDLKDPFSISVLMLFRSTILSILSDNVIDRSRSIYGCSAEHFSDAARLMLVANNQ